MKLLLGVRGVVRKGSGTTKTPISACDCKLFPLPSLGCQWPSVVTDSAPGPSGLFRGFRFSLSLAPFHGRSFAHNDPAKPEGPGAKRVNTPGTPIDAPPVCSGFSLAIAATACSSGETVGCVVGAPVRRRLIFFSFPIWIPRKSWAGCFKPAAIAGTESGRRGRCHRCSSRRWCRSSSSAAHCKCFDERICISVPLPFMDEHATEPLAGELVTEDA